MNFKKSFMLLLTFCLSIILVAPLASANNLDSSDSQNVKLKMTYIKVPNSKNVDIKRTEDSNSTKVEIFDKETGVLLDTYGETVEPVIQKGFNLQAGNYRIVTTTKDTKIGPGTVRMTVKMNVYSSGSFRQINSVESKTMAAITSGAFTLEDDDVVAISTTGSFPTHEITANGSGVLTFKGTKSSSAGFSFEIFKGFGFDMSGSSSSDWYARKYFEMGLTYNLYPY
ncbi:hypothetical protein J2Z32_002005 [Paenibacillus turicensis]|uniref:Uncharacterized protein n=1 Tax=Paenibacillus turicensis TaxID=160487 RepID=A0ABS4FS31_9BACL|nr:hypothetical protein [Paenibacillus turicensis]MBP1905375.1 hypothetical protein [Paenibacillus turicensis]